ncbi:EpsG family protein [Siminovitchia sediminis]|uniref:EpsG family protein n=1 Tax=Siminovitchia sediminis TaxID=1274353 RepID=A0ABW4KKY9_9BACI
MTLLWINLIVVFMCAFLARYFSTQKLAAEAVIPIIPNKPLIFGSLASLVVIAGLRTNIGDTYFYKHAFETNDFEWADVAEQENVGFWLLQKTLKQFSEDPQILLFTTALITNVLIVWILAKYSRMIELSLYVYITGGLFLVSMNGIRQTLTAAILFAATKYLIEGNMVRYFIVVLIASTFHQSALVLIPIYFIVRLRAWSVATFLLMVIGVAITAGYEYFSAFLFSAIENTQYGYYSDFQEGGASKIRVAVTAAPLLIAYLGRHKFRKIFPYSDVIVNMSLMGLVFMIVSTQNWIFARFTIYFNLYQLILISWVVKLFHPKDQRFVYFAILVCYFIYYFYENVTTLQIEFKSVLDEFLL